MWYVVQTQTGNEAKIKKLIERTMPEGISCKCMLYYFEGKRKYLGKWNMERKLLFPGYIIIETNDIDKVRFHLRLIPDFAWVVVHGEEVVPLTDSEVLLIRRLSGDTEVVAMSYGFKEGDEVTVTEGPLAGLEYRILKIDRHKRKAVIEMELFRQKKSVTVGLEILKKN